jgi:hypothetical protein
VPFGGLFGLKRVPSTAPDGREFLSSCSRLLNSREIHLVLRQL